MANTTSSFTYKLCKSKIENNMYTSQEEMQVMLDVFYAGERISLENYQELTTILSSNQGA